MLFAIFYCFVAFNPALHGVINLLNIAFHLLPWFMDLPVFISNALISSNNYAKKENT